MLNREAKVVDLAKAAATPLEYDNRPVAEVNDHVVRISIMTRPFHWHCHPNSDETFLVLEGRLSVDFEHESLEIGFSPCRAESPIAPGLSAPDP